jgi:hypothetical protein
MRSTFIHVHTYNNTIIGICRNSASAITPDEMNMNTDGTGVGVGIARLPGHEVRPLCVTQESICITWCRRRAKGEKSEYIMLE